MWLFRNTDFYDYDSDIADHEDNSLVLYFNCIVHAGTHSDDFDAGSGWIVSRNCVFYDPPGPGGIEFLQVDDLDSIDIDDSDPLYVNVGSDVPLLELDFHLNEGSAALTAGKDASGNETFAGSMGPAQ